MKKSFFLFTVALAFSLGSFGAFELAAQTQPSAGGIPAHALVTVAARKGSNVPEVSRNDVMVFEGHDRDRVTDWVPAQGDRAGLDLFVLLDDGSAPSLGTQLDDLRRFINSQPETTKVGVAYMQNGIAQIEQDLTSDHAQAAKAVRLPLGLSGVNASPYFSLSDLVKRWPEGSNRREVVMVSDGIDRYYDAGDLLDPYLAKAIEDAQRAGIIVYTIYAPGVGHFGHSLWRTYWGQIFLAQVSDQTGGESFYIGFNGPAVDFTPYLEDVTHHLGNQYFLTFLARPPKKAGFQQVRIMTEAPNVELTAPDRVYVPAGQ